MLFVREKWRMPARMLRRGKVATGCRTLPQRHDAEKIAAPNQRNVARLDPLARIHERKVKGADNGCPRPWNSSSQTYQPKRGPVIFCGTNTEPSRSASVKPKTKNWLGFEMGLPFTSFTTRTKSLSLPTHRV